LHHDRGQLEEAIANFQQAADDPALRVVALAHMAVCLCERNMHDLADEILDPLELTREAVLACRKPPQTS
jgi:hypothetical protein